MMYPYMTLNDDTEITHSEMNVDGTVKVYIETPDETGGSMVASGLQMGRDQRLYRCRDDIFQRTGSRQCASDAGVFTGRRNTVCHRSLR